MNLLDDKFVLISGGPQGAGGGIAWLGAQAVRLASPQMSSNVHVAAGMYLYA